MVVTFIVGGNQSVTRENHRPGTPDQSTKHYTTDAVFLHNDIHGFELDQHSEVDSGAVVVVIMIVR
jgi:hypothetical protein